MSHSARSTINTHWDSVTSPVFSLGEVARYSPISLVPLNGRSCSLSTIEKDRPAATVIEFVSFEAVFYHGITPFPTLSRRSEPYKII